ncbi:MFS transporter [Ahrensia sp. 13_GOM-1096m]|uniref:MFS transporter n=1 Tax=Ahrensia sp. 13_GOM-1096m TaxID=1380380 RepID=UPI00047C9E51|nr:MFS transporter [Ahrensia sp. 13_GOM-1096m]
MLFQRVNPIFLIIAIWLAGLGAAAQFAKITIIFGELSAYYGQSDARSGFLLSTISLLGVIFGLYAGVMGAKYGNRKLLIGGLFLGALTSFAQVLLLPFWGMITLRAIEGISHLAIAVAAPTLIASYATDKIRTYAMTLWGTYFGVAFALMSVISPAVLKNGRFDQLFLYHGIYMALIGILLVLCMPNPRTNLSTAQTPAPDTNFWIAHVQAYKSPFIAAPALGWVFYTLTFVSMITLLPQFVAEDQRLLVIGAMPVTSIIASLTLGTYLLRIMSAVKVVTVGFALAFVVSLVMIFSGVNAWMAIALYIGLGLVQGATFAAVPQLNNTIEDRSKANGLLVQTGNFGNLIGTPVLAVTIGTFNQSGMLVIACLAYVMGICVHILCGYLRNWYRPA